MSLATPTSGNAPAVNNGDFATPAFMNSNLDPLKNFTNALAGFTRVVTSASTYNITANTEIVVYVDATSGSKTVVLPASTGQYHSITVKKIDVTYNAVNVVTSGSDVIETIATNALVPITTTDSIRQPNSSRTYSPNGTQWRIESNYLNNKISFKSFLSTNTAITVATGSKMPFVTMSGGNPISGTWDLSNNFSTANNRFTIPVRGIYRLHGIFRFSSLSTTVRIDTRLFVNGADSTFLFDLDKSTTGGEFIIPWHYTLQLNVGDFVEIFCALITGSGTLTNANNTTYWAGEWTGIST
jgi:hypothetical protein